jgi:hypothetical protein
MREKPPYWQNYWFDLAFRSEGAASFELLGHEGPRQISNKGLATHSLEQIIDALLEDCVDELDDLHGELRVLIYTDPHSEPVMTREIQLKRR